MVSVHLDNAFIDFKPETLNNIKENIKKIFNISEFRKVKRFLRFYYE